MYKYITLSLYTLPIDITLSLCYNIIKVRGTNPINQINQINRKEQVRMNVTKSKVIIMANSLVILITN